MDEDCQKVHDYLIGSCHYLARYKLQALVWVAKRIGLVLEEGSPSPSDQREDSLSHHLLSADSQYHYAVAFPG